MVPTGSEGTIYIMYHCITGMATKVNVVPYDDMRKEEHEAIKRTGPRINPCETPPLLIPVVNRHISVMFYLPRDAPVVSFVWH